MDTFTPLERSRIMATVKSTHNRSTELRLLAALEQSPLRGWEHQPPAILGKPDFVFGRKKVAVFVDGCFWHGCPRCYRRPKSSRTYWDDKLKRNVRRDNRVRAQLRREGWSVLRVWEHSLKTPLSVLSRIQRALGKRNTALKRPQVPVGHD